MIRILVNRYPQNKADCPFCRPNNETCKLQEEFFGNEYGYGYKPKYCNGFDDNGEFNEEKCGMLARYLIKE